MILHSSPSLPRRVSLVLVMLAGGLTLAVEAQETTGNAERGKTYFSSTYNCYACHGFDAQTGQRRLKPMNYSQEGFITFVQNSPLPQMPAFPDVADQDLADIYAYILTIPIDAPSLDNLPLLQSIWAEKRREMGQ